MKPMRRAVLCSVSLIAGSCQPRSYNAVEQATGSGAAQGFLPVGNFYYPEAGAWSGRLILPKPQERRPDGGVWFEVYSSPGNGVPAGTRMWLGMDLGDANAKMWAQRTTIGIDFARSQGRADALLGKGIVLPERLQGWQNVSPLESLAGARSAKYRAVVAGTPTEDSIEVVLPRARVEGNTLLTPREPVQIVGREVTLVRFEAPAGAGKYRVRHWGTGGFSGPEEVVDTPKSVSEAPGRVPKSSFDAIHTSSLNAGGWFAFGEHVNGVFVIRAIEPRTLLDMKEDGRIASFDAGEEFFRAENFKNEEQKKGTATALRVDPDRGHTWSLGDRGIVVHLFGGIAGENGDKPALTTPLGRKSLYTGHFAYGFGRTWREPITGEPRFDIEYRQVYAHNQDGIISGAQKWAAYMGSVDRGWMWSRPVSDNFAKHVAFDKPFDLGEGVVFDALDELMVELDIMAARFRSGDGTGTSEVTGPNSCVQDSNQALFIALNRFMDWADNDVKVKAWLAANKGSPEEKRIMALRRLVNGYKSNVVRLAGLREDWREAVKAPLAIHREEMTGIEKLIRTIEGRQTLIPRWTYDDVSVVLLLNNAPQWVFHSSQIGGTIPNVVPVPAGFH